jgi:hypothetical protein
VAAVGGRGATCKTRQIGSNQSVLRCVSMKALTT